MTAKKTALVVLMAAGLCMVAAGCFVRPYRPAPVAAAYTPMMYNGYVVYYTTAGAPYYYIGGMRYWVPRVYWGRYQGYYFRHRAYYWRWYRHRGYRYRGRRYRPGYFRRGVRYRRGYRRGYRRRYHRRRYH